MKIMKRLSLLFTIVMTITAGLAQAAETVNTWPMEPFDADLENLPSLQNGMRLYNNYCLGCHALGHQRYERTADDLGMPHNLVLENLVFSGQKIGEQMTNAMSAENAKQWFGTAPPDLTMITRFKSAEYVYNYLKTFYADDSRPFGVNNKVFENVGMPNVLADLQGIQVSGCIQMPKKAENGGDMRDPLIQGKNITEEKCDQLYVEEGTGSMTADEFDAAVYDLTNYLYYVGEPSRLERHRIGIYVLLFLIILGCFTHLLNREYWKDVH